MSIEISSEDSRSSCDDLPDVLVPSQSDKVDLTMTDTDALFDDMFSSKKPEIPRTDSGVSGHTIQSIDLDKDYKKSSVTSLTQMDSGISVMSGNSVESDVLSGGSSNGRPKRKAAASQAEKAAEKETKKQKVAEERAAKQAANAANKVYKPGECMKYMSIEAHPTLLSSWFLSDLEREASSASARLAPSRELVDQGLVMWSRRKPRVFESGGDGQARLTDSTERCNHSILILTAEQIEPYILQHTLSSHIDQIRTMVDCPLTLVVFGVKDYYSSKRQKKQSDKRKFNDIELEMSFTDLLVTAGCDAVAVDKPIDLALLIVQFTKALAEAPHKLLKRSCDEQAEFYMRGDNKKCVAVDKDGNGLGRLWQQMLAVLPHCSLEASRAICANYSSPLQLFEKMQEPSSLNDLAKIGVDRAGVPGAIARKIGPEFARKLRTLITSEDGDKLLD